MKNIIVWGSGKGFENRKKEILEKYNVLAIADDISKADKLNNEFVYIKPDDIKEYEFDFILVCSLKYELSIKYQLIFRHGVDRKKIKGIREVLKMYSINEQIEDVIYTNCNKYIELNQRKEFEIDDREIWLIKDDLEQDAGLIPKHYFAQDLWGAKKIFANMPKEHYDIGSRIDGFISHILIFLNKVNYIDIRPLAKEINNLYFIQGDATNLDNIADNSITSLSSFHAVEHFGLGRYGDPIDPEACFKAMKSFERVLAPGGFLYFGVPIGPRNKVIFNAHRIFHPKTVIEAFENLKLVEFAIVQEDSSNYKTINLSDFERACKNLKEYSCGLFLFKKVI